jgi:signal transduction histidine kinase
VHATVAENMVVIEISDDGIGFPPDISLGRGLTGMRERVRALDGLLEWSRENGRTLVRCRLPLEPAAVEQARSA